MDDHKIRKVLIANRGEIAARIHRTCNRLGIATVGVASSADSNGLHTRVLDRIVQLQSKAPRDAYLHIPPLVAAAKESGCDAVHPGYGFLSENPDFADAVADAGLVFIGPSGDSIRRLGNKTTARAIAQSAGVPVSPGAEASESDDELARRAAEIGFPLIIKAAAGGGGRGMRIVRNAAELAESLPRARAEALKFFANGAVFVERYIERPRHVEVQVAGDRHGNVIHIGTRDCSTQRRNQKLVEEAPAPFLDPALLERIQTSAVAVAKSIGYYSLGTAEFLVKGEDFYFLEMNTRIQVEHPATELISGLDLVALQLDVAAGKPLGFSQGDVSLRGHAIEFRLNAENPVEKFAPSRGVIRSMSRAAGEGVREDWGYESGDEVTLHFDGLMSKILVHGADRNEALARARAALGAYRIEGIDTTLEFHRWLVSRSPFTKAPVDIGYLEREFNPAVLSDDGGNAAPDPDHRPAIAGAEVVEYFVIPSDRFSTRNRVEVIHRSDGAFVGIPIDESGSRLDVEYWRRSFGLQELLEGLKAEVFETVSPEVLSKSGKSVLS